MDRYRKKKKSFYNRNGRGIEDIEVKYKERDNLEAELINREKFKGSGRKVEFQMRGTI